MSFSYSNGVVTQSGTNTSLAGIEAMFGVTAHTFGAGNHQRIVYEFAGVRLLITGSLTFNPNDEQIYMDENVGFPNIQVNNNATLHVNGKETLVGFDVYSKLTAIYCGASNTSTGYINDAGSIDVENGGTLLWDGGEINTGQSLVFIAGSTIRINEGIWYGRGTNNVGLYNQCVIRLKTNDFEARGLRFGGNVIIYQLHPSGVTLLERVEPVGTVNNLSGLNAYNPSSVITLSDFKAGQGNVSEVAVGYNAIWEFDDVSNGTELLVVGGRSTGSTGIVEVYGNIDLTVLDTSNSPIAGAVVFCRDTDHGDRPANLLGRSWTADRVYDDATSAAGEVSYRVLTGVANLTGDPPGTPGIGQGYIHKRGEINDSTDQFDFHAWEYNYQHRVVSDVQLKGQGGTQITAKLLADPLITETNQTTVGAYTHADSPAKTYDIVKLWKMSNLESPSIDEIPLTREGTLLNVGAYNLTLNPNASSVFSLVGSMITLKCATFVGDIITTGLITLQNGALVSGIYTDQNGTVSPPASLTLTGLQVNSEVRLYEVGTATEILGVENSGTSEVFPLAGSSSVDVIVHHVNYKYIRLSNVDTSVDVTLPIQQVFDRNYQND